MSKWHNKELHNTIFWWNFLLIPKKSYTLYYKSYTHFYMFIYKPFLQVHLQAIFTSSITSHIYKFE